MTVASPYEALVTAMQVTAHTIVVAGSSTKYWQYGPRDAATTLVMVHGYRGEHHGLEAVVAHLDGLNIISPDLPAFGESSPLGTLGPTPQAVTGQHPDPRQEPQHDIAGYAMWLEAFVDRLDLTGTAIIVGHSFGSIVAASAVARGLSTPRLILINPIAAPALSGPNAFMSRVTLGYYRAGRALGRRLGERLMSSWLVVRFMSIFLAQTNDKKLRRWIHDQHHTYFSRYANLNTLLQGFEASISSDVSMFAPSIPVPTLLIGADEDPITTVAAQQRLEGLFPDAHLVTISGVGHLVHYEKPREAAEAIVAFVGAGRVVA